jgi:hypothetical protein
MPTYPRPRARVPSADTAATTGRAGAARRVIAASTSAVLSVLPVRAGQGVAGAIS